MFAIQRKKKRKNFIVIPISFILHSVKYESHNCLGKCISAIKKVGIKCKRVTGITLIMIFNKAIASKHPQQVQSHKGFGLSSLEFFYAFFI